ncbi:hypothetical protein [Ochrobactrum sp. MYb379]|uniref:hypothetical protein n=1 Tax=Ochrobactrum sp. MYb379 TaxID=2745275 RepID=UPI0030B49A6D
MLPDKGVIAIDIHQKTVAWRVLRHRMIKIIKLRRTIEAASLFKLYFSAFQHRTNACQSFITLGTRVDIDEG